MAAACAGDFKSQIIQQVKLFLLAMNFLKRAGSLFSEHRDSLFGGSVTQQGQAHVVFCLVLAEAGFVQGQNQTQPFNICLIVLPISGRFSGFFA